MSTDAVKEVVDTFLNEADAAYKDRLWRKSAAAAARAVQAATIARDPFMILRSLYYERRALWKQADFGTALVRDTQALAIAEDYAGHEGLSGYGGAWYIAMAKCSWVQDMLNQTGNDDKLRQLLEVLDDAERWLVARGYPNWRSGLLLHRSRILSRTGERDKAINVAQEALDLALRQSPSDPGYSIGDHKVTLADFLRRAKRDEEAAAIYRELLDNPNSFAYERVYSYHGLAEIALDAGRMEEGLRYARQGVQVADAESDFLVVCDMMYTLVRALLLSKDMDGAHQMVLRYEAQARATGTKSELYFALRSRFDVEFALGNRDQAKTVLAELEKIATALDREDGKAAKATEVARRYERMTQN